MDYRKVILKLVFMNLSLIAYQVLFTNLPPSYPVITGTTQLKSFFIYFFPVNMKTTILGALLLLAVINLSTAKNACILWDKDGNAGCVVEGEIEENVRII